MNNIQMNSVNLNTNVSNSKQTQESKPQEEAKPQLKEHCSSKTGQALKNAALGVMLAASVIAGAKAVTVPAKAVEPEMVDNSTSVSEQAEETYTKSELEEAVQKAVDECEEKHANASGVRTIVECGVALAGLGAHMKFLRDLKVAYALEELKRAFDNSEDNSEDISEDNADEDIDVDNSEV